MSGRVIVVQASSSEDESMSSPVAGGDGAVEFSNTSHQANNDSPVNVENKNIHRYNREDMLKLYNHPSAKVRPSILSPEFDLVVENGEGGTGDSVVNTKLWSPELWIQSIWNPEPRQTNSSSGSGYRRQGDHDGPLVGKKKQIDRLKTENEDGIVLSPQRRSFVAGCQVASSSTVASANVAGSQNVGGGGGPTSAVTSAIHQNRRSTSPPNAGGDDRQQTVSQHSNSRSSFRGRGAVANSVNNAPVPQQQPPQVQNAIGPAVVGAGYGRGDRVENWRDRSSYSSSSYGRGGGGQVGKEAPAQINTYARSRGGGTNSWGQTGGGRRSYGGGGGYHHHGESETLPEWVTEGPSDMYETMELRGFDEEERQQMQMEHNNLAGGGGGAGSYGQRRGAAPARMQQYRSSTDYQSEKENSNRRSSERNEQNQQSKRDSKSPMTQQQQHTRKSDGDKVIGKMTAEALVDGFDIGDMAQFLSAAGADFDSIANGELTSQHKSSPVVGNSSGQVPTTPSAASRFSKFFGHQSQAVGYSDEKKGNKSTAQKSHKQQQQQSVNIMELLSKAAVVGDSNRSGGIVAGNVSVPAGAKSLDEIEAAYKSQKAQKKPEAEGSSNKVLQELFQSARSGNVSNLEAHQQRGDQRIVSGSVSNDQQAKYNQMTEQQQAADLLQKAQQPNAAGGGGGVPVTKGNPLADPAQQQHFLDALRKLHVQQQQPLQHHQNTAGTNDGANPFLAAYPQLAGLQHLLQQQQMAQMNNLQAAMNNSGRVPSPLGLVAGVGPVSHQQSTAGSSAAAAQAINPAFAGFMPPANVPPPPITQQDLLLAHHTQSIYQRAMMMGRKPHQGIEEPPPKPIAVQQGPAPVGKMSTAFLPTSVIKQMHGGSKANKDNGEDSNASGSRPIVKQQQQLAAFSGQQQEQVSPSSINDQLLRHFQHQQQSVNKTTMPGQAPPLAPPPSLTPQDLQRLIDQTHLQQRQQRQHQERVLLEQYAKTQQQQQQLGANPAAMNPAAVSAALALQNNPMFVQMLRAQAMQAQQMAMLQQQAAAAAAAASSGMQAPPQPIPASAAVSAIPSAAQLVRARMAPPSQSPQSASSNPELMRHVLQQQHHQQMLFNQLRQQAPADANMLLNRLLTGQAAQQQQQQQQMHQMPQSNSMAGLHFPTQGGGSTDAKPMTLEDLERLHKQAAAMQQPQS